MERDDIGAVFGDYKEDFNSHAHVERDSQARILEKSETISTHTLTWSVTGYSVNDWDSWSFQLTRSRGA